ncbi:MAG: hypothetical protein LBI78_07170 [Campylobacteraceae bacterium]|nr:hypothetical protein [Campylobacteraceae bacterium]
MAVLTGSLPQGFEIENDSLWNLSIPKVHIVLQVFAITDWNWRKHHYKSFCHLPHPYMYRLFVRFDDYKIKSLHRT